jgi:hypothetical protein
MLLAKPTSRDAPPRASLLAFSACGARAGRQR